MLQSLWMLAASFFYAVMSSLVKQCSLETGVFEIVFFRALLSLLFIFAIMRVRHIGLATHYPFKHFLRSICGAIAFTLWFAATAHLPLGTAVTLSYAGPIFIALTTIVLCLMRRQKAPWLLAVAIGIGFAGICMMMRPTFGQNQAIWALAALTTSAFAPIIFMTVQKLGQAGEPSTRIVFYFMLVSTIWGAIGVYCVEGGIHMHSTGLWAMLLGVGLCSTLGQICMTQAYARGNLLVSACLQFSTIPIAEVLSVVVFGERLPIDGLIGMGLILVAGIMATVTEKRKEKRRREATTP